MNRTVLLVEDDSGDTQLIRRAFAKAKIMAELFRAKDGDDAVAYLDGQGKYEDRNVHPLPSMILLDIKLPRRSGFEVLSWIRRDPRSLRRTPVVMLTSSRHSVDINRAFELGANAYTVKPDTHAELVQLLEAIGGFWFGKNEFPILSSSGTAVKRTATHSEASAGHKILLVEDERSDAALIIRGLEVAGFKGTVQHVIDGRSAIHTLKMQAATGEVPTIILLDLKLPGMSGFEVLEEVRRTPGLRQLPVIVLANAQDIDTINAAYEKGANSYLLKSPDSEQIMRLILFMQEYWISMNQSVIAAPSRRPDSV